MVNNNKLDDAALVRIILKLAQSSCGWESLFYCLGTIFFKSSNGTLFFFFVLTYRMIDETSAGAFVNTRVYRLSGGTRIYPVIILPLGFLK